MGIPSKEARQLRSAVACAALAALVWLPTPQAAEQSSPHRVPLFLAADRAPRQGFVRIINHSPRAGTVTIDAIDDEGSRHGPLTLSIAANRTVHFNSDHLEDGNPSKGLSGGVGDGAGDWRLQLTSDLDIEALAYIRTSDGMLASMHDTVPFDESMSAYQVATFNPGSNYNQESQLRLTNLSDEAAEVRIIGIDGNGVWTEEVIVAMPANASRTFTAEELESGGAQGVQGALGTGHSKWRLLVESWDQEIAVMSLLSSPTGHLTNLSTVPNNAVLDDEAGYMHSVPLFPAASDPDGRQGFVRVINPTDVRIDAFDDSGQAYQPLTLNEGWDGWEQATHFNSNDLEAGAPSKRLVGGTGPGNGNWRLKLTTWIDIKVLAYIRIPKDGFLTAMHDTAPGAGTRYRVATFNPGSNYRQVSLLRLVNPQSETATVSIQGIDDSGAPGDEVVWLTVPAGSSRTIDAKTLESGGSELQGALGDGAGKWQLIVNSDRPLFVMSLMESPTGHLMNISTAPVRGATGLPPPPPPAASGRQRAATLFSAKVSGPVVQLRCVACHAQGGTAGQTRMVFTAEADAGHEEANLAVFESFLDEVERGEEVILDKVQGVDHDGGIQITPGSEDWMSLEEFLLLLGGSG